MTDAVTWFDVSENENAIANMIDLTKFRKKLVIFEIEKLRRMDTICRKLLID